MPFQVGIVKKNGTIIGKRVESREEADEYILSIAEKEEIKLAKIRDLKTGFEERIDF